MGDPVIAVSDVRFIAAKPADRQRGLLGYLAFVLNGAIEVDGVTLRRSAAGSTYLAYPARVDGRGERHPYLRPIDDLTRETLEQAVLTALGQGGWR